jgi:hypothetical protein
VETPGAPLPVQVTPQEPVASASGDDAHGASMHAPVLLYLDQNYLSGMAKGKPAFRELEPVLRDAVARGRLAVPEARPHAVESAPRPDLGLLELLRGLACGRRLPEPDRRTRALERQLAAVLARDLPHRRPRGSDRLDLEALALALPRCRLVTCDALMADVVRRSGLDVGFGSELFTGRRADVDRLRARVAEVASTGAAETAVSDGKRGRGFLG